MARTCRRGRPRGASPFATPSPTTATKRCDRGMPALLDGGRERGNGAHMLTAVCSPLLLSLGAQDFKGKTEHQREFTPKRMSRTQPVKPLASTLSPHKGPFGGETAAQSAYKAPVRVGSVPCCLWILRRRLTPVPPSFTLAPSSRLSPQSAPPCGCQWARMSSSRATRRFTPTCTMATRATSPLLSARTLFFAAGSSVQRPRSPSTKDHPAPPPLPRARMCCSALLLYFHHCARSKQWPGTKIIPRNARHGGKAIDCQQQGCGQGG